MHPDELQEHFDRTLDDGRLSRSERQALAEVFEDVDLSPSARAGYLNRAFALAEGAMSRMADREVLDWLLALAKTLAQAGRDDGPPEVAEALFTPADDIPARLRSLIARSSATVRLCIFTVTDNSLVTPLLEARDRGVDVRLITDDEKSLDRGSDALRLAQAGIAVRSDRIPDHMHHKFAVFDGRIAVTGSYNWTRSAARRNYENLVVTDDRRMAQAFTDEFERLWEQFESLTHPI